MKKLLPFILLAVLACDKPPEEPVCEDCTAAADSSFDQRYFRLLLNENMQPILVRYDTASGASAGFRMCPAPARDELYASVEFTQVVSAGGMFKRSCTDDMEQLVELTGFEIVYTCLPDIPQLEGEVSLFRTWYVHWLEEEGTVLYPPCEGVSFIRFVEEDDEYFFEGNLSINGFAGPITLPDSNTMQLAEYVITLAVGTEQQIAFERLLLQVFERNAALTYTIEGNLLTLTNPATHATARLFALE